MNIYAGNLSYNLAEEELQDVFAKFGEVASVTIIMDRYTNRSKGFGFVEMPNSDEAESAIEALNDTIVNGRTIKVNQAKPRPERGPRY